MTKENNNQVKEKFEVHMIDAWLEEDCDCAMCSNNYNDEDWDDDDREAAEFDYDEILDNKLEAIESGRNGRYGRGAGSFLQAG